MAKKHLLEDDDFKIEFAKIKQQIMDKQLELNDSRIEEFDLDGAVDYVFAFIKTIPDYWKDATYQQRVKLQNAIFPEKCYFDKEKFGTPNLSHIFKAKAAFEGGKNCLVVHWRLRPALRESFKGFWRLFSGANQRIGVAGLKFNMGQFGTVSRHWRSRVPDKFGTFGTRLKGMFRVPFFGNETNETQKGIFWSCVIFTDYRLI